MANKVQEYNADGKKLVGFLCPGCNTVHVVNVDTTSRPAWSFNGDLEHPTFYPSLLMNLAGLVCHSFVRNGLIAFMGDCSHDLKNKTVELGDID